ncbi:polymorphic toxin-type HINT domain-containing protein [Embleya sp. NBC_00896]|uniref:polymorphic toxin-type HINT domain-containing protein n=1 Tax=Embleya sp. NBC_00896 TaxID=2975961 RepID=UPI002F915F78|nr:polymorphic toxin-type HINT domain-containing protein [Embleya sp. NBC_00896]
MSVGSWRIGGTNKRGRRGIARPLVVVGTVLALFASVGPAQAQGLLVDPRNKPAWSPSPLDHMPSVGGSDAPKPKIQPLTGDGRPAWKPAKAQWPAPLEAETVPAPESATRSSGLAALLAAPGQGRVGDSPIRVTTPAGGAPSPLKPRTALAPNTAPAPAKVKVTLADRAATDRAGVDGVLLSIGRTDGRTDTGRVTVSIDYSAFRDAFGADWSTRLRLFALPECALTTPDRAECRTRTPIDNSRNDRITQRVTADIDLPARTAADPAATGRMVLAATAADAGPSGDFKATSLSASGSWTAGGNSGSLNWSYPIPVPPAIGGTAPQINLAYNSGGVDGRTTSTNNQASWIGEGWEYSPGFVERSYQACAKDGQDKSGEMCWSDQNSLTLSLNGRSSTLLRDDVSKTWRLQEDDGSRIELLTGASNGDDDGEHWRLTATDGVQYYFGAGHKPGNGNTGPATNATWTSPVYGNNTGEPCNKASGFDASWCQQAWRWNLDHVVDARGGLVTFTYNEEKNNYTRGAVLVGSGTLTPYTRGGTLAAITYGSKTTDTTEPTAQILFDTAERCLKKDGFDCDPAKMTKANAAKWPDVPVDKVCAATGTCEQYGQTFFSTRRLTKITTQTRVGTGYRTVDEYALDQDYPDPQDGSTATLWLNSITHTAYDGTKKIDTPSVDFTGKFKPNRVDAGGDMAPPMNRRRITGITNETGGQTTVDYNDPECTPAALPTPDANTKACHPTWWSYGDSEPVLHWFHKYTVAQVTQHDPTTHGAVDTSTRYEYLGGAAWHRDDSELTEDKEASKPKSKDRRTWNDYRGYAEVITRSGAGPDKVTKSKSLYLRGMDGDVRKDGSKREVTVTDSAGTVITDANPLQGFAYETQTFDGNDVGNKVVSTTSLRPWTSATTATHKRARDLPDLTAQMTRTDRTHTRDLLADDTWRKIRKETTYDPTYGLPTEVADFADNLDPFCTTTTYAHNTTAWIIGKPTEVVSVVGDCATTPTQSTVYAQSRVYYDGLALGQVGAVGDVTATEAATDYKAGAPEWLTTAKSEYDAHGRVVKATDAENNVTTTAYEPAAGALPTRTTVTNAKGWTSVQEFAGPRNLPVRTVDANGLVMQQEYDALGRLIAVWQPGHAKTADADLQFAYQVNKTAPSVVTTRTLRINGRYTIANSILGAFLQPRQSQTSPGNEAGGRLVADTFYDSLGRPLKTNQPYYESGAEPNGSVFVATDTQVPAQTTFTYDGQGRKTAEGFSSKTIKQWETRTAYQGADKVTVTPPAGGVKTMSTNDARGKPTELREYRNDDPTGTDFTAITYTYTPREELKSVTDAGGNTWTYTYDFLGRRTHTEDPDKGPSDTAYDKVGRVLTTTDARGQQLHYAYDQLGRKTSLYKGATAKPENLLAGWFYDTLAKGQQDKSIRYVGGAAGAQYVSEITGFDADSYRPTGTRVTIPAAEGKLAGVYQTTSTYEKLTGRPTSLTLPAHGGLPAEDLGYSYLATGQLGGLAGQDPYLFWADYDELGRNTRAYLGSEFTLASFTSKYDDATGRLLGTEWAKSTADTPVDVTSYTYKPSGDVTSISTKRDTNTTDTQCFTYDGNRRLKQAWTDTAGTTTEPAPKVPGIGGCVTQTPTKTTVGGPDPYWQTFDYDAVGNRTKLVEHDVTDDPAKNVTTEYGYRAGAKPTDRTHRLDTVTVKTGTREAVTTNLTYDPNGNTKTRPGTDANLQTLTWNEEDKLTTVATATSTSSYLYDADGNRIVRRENGKTTLYLGSDELTTNTNGTGPVIGTRYYPTAGGATVIRNGTGTLTYMAADNHGTANSTLDATTLTATRRQSKPFGEPRGAQPTQANGQWPDDKGFLGKPMDATGLTHIGAREYDPTLGRFISVDPLMDLSDTQQMHGYTYSNNSPVTLSDPTGLLAGQMGNRRRDKSGGGGSLGNRQRNERTGDSAPVTTGGGTDRTGGGSGCRQYIEICKPATSMTVIVPPEFKKGTKTPDRNDYVQIGAGLLAGGYRAFDPCALTSGYFVGKRCGSDMVDDWAARNGLNESPYGCDGVMDCEDDYGNGKKLFSVLSLMAGAASFSGNTVVRIPCNSFLPETQILMADGLRQPIQDIKPGDVVLATDPETGESKPRTVLASITTEDDKDFADVTVMTDQGDASIIATAHHVFWVPDLKQWVDASDLKPGQWLLASGGTWVRVSAVRLFGQPARTYNLTVDTDHTYYVGVGDQDVLVHNCGAELLSRARQLHGTRADEVSTVAVARVQNVRDPNKIETWVATERTGLPNEWRGGAAPLRGERYIPGEGHAEATIINATNGQWNIIGMASSTRMCPGCLAQARQRGLTQSDIGKGNGISSTGNTPWRVVLGGGSVEGGS